MLKRLLTVITLTIICATSVKARELDKIKESGYLSCGVVNSFRGFSYKEASGEWTGFMPDWCRIVAVGIFNDAQKVKFKEISGNQLQKTVTNDTVDIIATALPISFSAAKKDMRFSFPVYYDKIGILAKKELLLRQIGDLKSEKNTICTYKEFTSLKRLSDYLGSATKKETAISVKGSLPEAVKAYKTGKCRIFAGNGVYMSLLAEADDNVLIDDAGDLQYGLAVNEKYERLFKLVNWSFFATVIAAENGITSENIDSLSDKTNGDTAVLYDNRNGKTLGIDEKWFYNIIKKMGNYRQIYDKNLKDKLPLEIKGHLWRNPNAEGIIYYPTID